MRLPQGTQAGVSVAATDVRAGMLLEHEGKLLEVISQTHNAGQARQSGNVMLDCRDVLSNTKTKMKVAPSKALEVRTHSILCTTTVDSSFYSSCVEIISSP